MKTYTIFLTLFIISFISCKSQQVINDKIKPDIQDIMQNEANRYKKSTSKYRLSPKVIRFYKNKSIDTLYSDNFFWNIKNFKDISTEKDIIDFTALFKEEDYQFMKQQFIENKIETWRDLIDYNFDADKNLKVYSYSMPVFSKDYKYSIVYVENLYGGYLNVLKINEKGEWEVFAKGNVWIW